MKQKSQVINNSILESASIIFSKLGYEKTTISKIAEHANVATGTIYVYFKNKEELLNMIYQDWRKRQYRFVMDGFDSVSSPREQFHHLWTKLIEFGVKYRAGLMFLEDHFQAPYLTEESLQLWKNTGLDVVTIIKSAQERSYVKNIDPYVITSMVNGALRGLVNDCKLNDSIIAETEQCMWEAIRA